MWTMRTRRLSLVILVAIVAMATAACGRAAEAPDGGRRAEAGGVPTAYVVNEPLAYFARRIAGGLVSVVFPIRPGVDPAFWMPDVETIRAYQLADVILLNGAGYAQWVETAALPRSRIVDTSASFADAYIVGADSITHQHGPTGEHTDGTVAFTTWLDPALAVMQADAVRAAFVRLLPEHAETFQQNFDRLASDLEALDDRLRATVAPQPVIFARPVYQYLARRYGLNARSLHWEPDVPPTDAMWTRLQRLLEEHPARWMIWEARPAKPVVARLAELGIECVVIDPCGNLPAEGDYLRTQRKNVENLAAVFASP